MIQDQRDASDNPNFLTNDRLRDDLLPGRTPLPRAPLQFGLENTGSGVRVTVVNDGPLGGRLNGATSFVVYWAEKIDNTTAAGKAAGFARATALAPSIPATNVDHTSSSALFPDPKYAAGWFYLVGVDAAGSSSEPTEPAQVAGGAVDLTVPGDVTHLQISESGRVMNGTVMSELSVTCSPPADTNNLGRVQLYLKDFNGLGTVQEGFSHVWRGSGGINFDVVYPIPRRRGTGITITATNGSPGVTAAGGLLAIAQVGDSLELNGFLVAITSVTDTSLGLTSNWVGIDAVTDDFSIVALVTVYAVSVGKSGSRRDDITLAPNVAVLMDGNISAPNSPATMYVTNQANDVLIEWDQVAGSTIVAYNIYRTDGIVADLGMLEDPPQPTLGTILLDKVPQNANLPVGSDYVRMQYHDSRFTLYDLEANSAFIWYITTVNTRGDESHANYAVGNARRSTTGEIDPTQVGRNPGKNYLYNAALAGTAGNQVLANDLSQDAYMGLVAPDAPGKPFGAASGQAFGAGRYDGFTRWESNDAGTGAAGMVIFQNGDEIKIPPPGAAKLWYLYQEIGAWDEELVGGLGTRRKVGKGEVYTLSVWAKHEGVTPDGAAYMYIEQYDDNTFKSQAARRLRDTNSSIITSSTKLALTPSELTATAVRYQAQFQLDAGVANTEQIRVNFSWDGGTVGVIVLQKMMLNAGEAAAAWTADMGAPEISIPVPSSTPTGPTGDNRTERAGEGQRYRDP